MMVAWVMKQHTANADIFKITQQKDMMTSLRTFRGEL